MFKVAFPWASVAEEDAEKKHIKSFPEAGQEEIAGNVWIPVEKGQRMRDDSLTSPFCLALLSQLRSTNTSQRLSLLMNTTFAIGFSH